MLHSEQPPEFRPLPKNSARAIWRGAVARAASHEWAQPPGNLVQQRERRRSFSRKVAQSYPFGFATLLALALHLHRLDQLLRPSISITAATTRSGWKPNLRCNSLSGAEAPKAFMPMTRPWSPT